MEVCYIGSNFYTDGYNYFQGCPKKDDFESFYTQDKEVMVKYKSMGFNISYIERDKSLYDLYMKNFFGSCTDEELVEIIVRGYCRDSDYAFVMYHEYAFCCFTLKDNKIDIISEYNFTEPFSIYSCGNFIKLVKRDLVLRGFNVNNIVFLSWGEMPEQYQTKYIDIRETLWGIHQLDTLSFKECLLYMSKSYNQSISCSGFVRALSDISKIINLKYSNGFSCRKNYYKDFSQCTCNESSKGQYGIVLDCEGVKGSDGSLQNGCREIGGIIFGSYKKNIVNLYSFIGNDDLIEDTLKQVVEVYRDITGKRGVIPLYVYGRSDKIMLKYTMDKFKDKRLYKRFEFIDCSSWMKNDNKSLNKVAKDLGVYCVLPKHNALSDARTLFNILNIVGIAQKGDLK